LSALGVLLASIIALRSAEPRVATRRPSPATTRLGATAPTLGNLHVAREFTAIRFREQQP
jgi:hypothetical protein